MKVIPGFGFHLQIVPAGTTVTDERSGEQITVDDRVSAKKGSVMWVTQATYDRIGLMLAPVKGSA